MGGKMIVSGEIKEKLLARRDEIITVAMGRTYYPGGETYDFNNLGWFKLTKWLKESPVMYDNFMRATFNAWVDEHIRDKYLRPTGFIDYYEPNLPQIFVEWLWTTNFGYWEECEGTSECAGTGSLLTPLGKLMKEII